MSLRKATLNEKDTGSNGHDEATVFCNTTKGPFTAVLKEDWSPIGYAHAVELFDRGFFDHSHFFRVVPKFLVQFGISYTDDAELQKFSRKTIQDDPQLNPRIPFQKGTISYAGSGPNSRTSHLFISYGSAKSLGTQLWETPIGRVTEGMENVERFYSYGDMPPWGKGPKQGKIYGHPEYIENGFPLTDKFLECSVSLKSTQDRIAREKQVQRQLRKQEDWNLITGGAIILCILTVVLFFIIKEPNKKKDTSKS